MKTLSTFLTLFLISIALYLVNVSTAQVADKVYLHYAATTTNAKILYVYQKLHDSGDATTADKWFRWQLFQYSGGNGSWTVHQNSVGQVSKLVLETNRDSFTYVNGSGDSGSYTTWDNYSIGNIVAKRRDSLSDYNQYSAYATYTATDNYTDVYLGVHLNSSTNGVIRVKINDVVSTTGLGLDSSGEYDEAAHGIDNTNPAWIHIGTNIRTGDVIKVEAKGDTLNDRHVITGLRFYQDTIPGESGWSYINSNGIMDNFSSQDIAVNGYVPGQTGGYKFGVAHGHEYSSGALVITMDSNSYALDSDLVYNQVISGNTLVAIATSTGYGDAISTDDFCTLTRTMTWISSNILTQAWKLDFTNAFKVSRVYSTMWPIDYSAKKIFRYVQFGDNLVVLLTNDGNDFPLQIGPAAPTGKMTYFGGTANLRVAIQTTTPLEEEWIADNSQKSYFYADTDIYYGSFYNGDSLSSTSTITLSYETPSDVDWSGKTLYVAKDTIISSAEDFIPFNDKNIIVKFIADSGVGLSFSGLAPTGTYFTSQDDNTVGIREMFSTGSPGKDNWDGISVSGTVSASYNIISYTTAGLTLTGNANAYNNSFNQNTTGISAASGSTVKNNALVNSTTYTTGDGNFDYNCYLGNAETHGINGDPLFINAASSDFSLQLTSPCIDAGTDLGSSYRNAFNPSSVWPSSVTTLDQSLRGLGWEIGAYIYPVPIASTITTPTVLSSSAIRWNFTDNADNEIGFRLYNSNGTLVKTVSTANLSYIDETDLSPGTTYSRYIKAYNPYGESASSATKSAQTGNASVSSRPLASPSSTPDNPLGGFRMVINDNATSTDTRDVSLKFYATPEIIQVAISESPYMSGSSLQTFQSIFSWTLSQGNGLKTIYAVLANQYGVKTPIISDSITLIVPEQDQSQIQSQTEQSQTESSTQATSTQQQTATTTATSTSSTPATTTQSIATTTQQISNTPSKTSQTNQAQIQQIKSQIANVKQQIITLLTQLIQIVQQRMLEIQKQLSQLQVLR